MSNHKHASHPAIIKRLNRATGHLRSIVTMIEEGGPASTSRSSSMRSRRPSRARSALINDHIDHCLSHAADEGGAARAIEISRRSRATCNSLSRYWLKGEGRAAGGPLQAIGAAAQAA
jgi:DNA-binding FrmR family transcriptional regulator